MNCAKEILYICIVCKLDIKLDIKMYRYKFRYKNV